MKDFDEKPSSIEIKEVEEEKKDLQWIGEMVMAKGMPTWEYDPETKQLVKAEFEEKQVQLEESPRSFIGSIMPHNKIVTRYRLKKKPGHVYFQALNKKNAIRKIEKYL